MTTYDTEVAGLATAYQAAVTSPSQAGLAAAHEVLRGRTAFAVASGGAFPAARFAARLHSAKVGQMAVPLTPLGYLGVSPPVGPACLILASATTRHPDTALAVQAALDREHTVLLLTQRPTRDLTGPLANPAVTVLTVPQPDGRDGFLATKSLLITAVVLARIYSEPDGDKPSLPDVLPSLVTEQAPSLLRRHVLVLHGPDEQPAADDIEARLSEIGLAAVQVADYRTFAHGRHFGLSRLLDDTTIVALSGPASVVLANRTLALLPAQANVVRLGTPLEQPAGVLDLLVQCMRLPILTAAKQNVALHRPGVPEFGRRLYHLAARAKRSAEAEPAVRRKMRAAGLNADDPSRAWYEAALDEWLSCLQTQRLGALVLDYDGTVVTTAGRYSLPALYVRNALLTIINSGLPVAFASGRGDSLHCDLRKWVPRSHWHEVLLGLHNGSWQLRLSDDPREELRDDPQLTAAAERLSKYPDRLLTLRHKPRQVTVTSSNPLMGADALRGVVLAAVSAAPALNVHVAGSGHSVDVTSSTVGKHGIVERLAADHGPVLAIGDRGDPGGNDFSMLAATPWSLSVDRCSADPSRCWGLAPAAATGPAALVAQISLLHAGRGGHRFASNRRGRHPITQPASKGSPRFVNQEEQ